MSIQGGMASRRADAARATWMQGKLLRLLCAAAMACMLAAASLAMPCRAAAAPVRGKLSLVCASEHDGSPVALAGDTYVLARVATAHISYDANGEPSIAFEPAEGFEAYDYAWTELDADEWRRAARELDDHASEAGLYTAGQAVSDAAGRVRFGWLDGGIYVVRRSEVAEANAGYACDPVLVSVPALEDGVLVYDVVADLKFEWTETPAPPEEPSPEPPPEDPFDELIGRLTQTDDPTLAVGLGFVVAGGCALLIGWRIRRHQRDERATSDSGA